MVTHRAFPIRGYSSGVLCSEIVMRIKSLKKFINFIKKFNLSEDKEELARAQFLNQSLDDHDFWMNRESRKIKR